MRAKVLLIMTVPLVVLAVPTIFFGWLGLTATLVADLDPATATATAFAGDGPDP